VYSSEHRGMDFADEEKRLNCTRQYITVALHPNHLLHKRIGGGSRREAKRTKITRKTKNFLPFLPFFVSQGSF
jgi:hypothetical protein